MDKLKNIMSGNKNKDTTVDNTLATDRTNKHAVSGEGSHFPSSHTTGTEPLSSSTNPASATGSNLAQTGTHGLSEPYSSRMPGTFNDDATTTASVSSGIPGRGQTGNTMGSGAYDSGVDTNKTLPTQPGTSGSGLASSGMTGSGMDNNTTAGPHSSNLQNKLDPRVDSDLDGRSGLSSNTTTGTGSGLAGNTSSGLGSAPDSGRAFPLGGSTNTGTTTGSNTGFNASGKVGTYPAGGAGVDSTGTSGRHGVSTTAGPHSSNLENKLDPRVDSDLDGRSGLGNTNTGTMPGNTGHLGRDTALGAGAGAGATAAGARSGHGSEPWGHNHGGHSHTYEGDPCGPESAVPGGPHFTTGPHATDTANRLDPHVASGIGSPSSTTGTSTGSGLGSSNTSKGVGSSTFGADSGLGSSNSRTTPGLGSSTTGTDHHLGRDTALGAGAGAGAAGVGANEIGREYPQSSSTGPAPNTAGPHKSDMLNKIDPRVDSDLSKQQHGTTGYRDGYSNMGATSSDPYTSSTGAGHHTGRDAALAGGAGAAGLGAYETEKHHHQKHDPSNTTGTSGLGSSTMTDEPHHSHHQGHHDRQQHAGDHHLGRDAGLAGAGGVAAYEAEKHHQKHDPSSTTSTSGLGPSTITGEPHHSHHQGHHDRQQHAGDHHLGRDAGLAGAGTAAGYEAERHHGHPTQSSNIPSTTAGVTAGSRDGMGSGYNDQPGTGHHYGRDAGIVGAGGVGAYEAEKHLGHHNTTGERMADSSYQPGATAMGTGHPDHHIGRDATVGAGAVGAAYEGEKHHHNKDHPTSTAGVTSSQDPQHHYGRDTALGAGAVGAGYEANKHYENKEARKLEHQQDKEEKHHDSNKKSGGILGLLHRNKGDKEAKKEERVEEKAERKAEHGHHTGRDATLGAGVAGTAYEADKIHQNRGPGNEEMAAGSGRTGLESDMRDTNLEGQHRFGEGHAIAGSRDHVHGSQAGVHDSAISSGSGIAGIPGGPTTHDAYGEQDPNRTNRLHKDPPAGRGF